MVACSGGRDSLSLARALHLLRPDYVRVVHVNHQLQQPSNDWANWLTEQCAAWHLPCTIKVVQVNAGNLEEQARKARYAALFDVLQTNEILVLGHHQQDQAETVFLRLLSGSGAVGLSAMKMLETRKGVPLWRPLLGCTRQQITQLAALICPHYIDDPANELENFDRVFLRQQIWPLLQSRWPGMDSSFSRTATLMQDCSEILQDVVQLDWQRCGNEQQLDIAQLLNLGIARQRLLLSRWMQGQEQYAPAFHLVEQLRDQLIEARQDANPKIVWQGWQFRRYQNKLHRLPKNLVLATDLQLEWPLQTMIELPTGTWQWQQCAFGFSPYLMTHTLQLKARQGGEMLHVKGRVGHWPLKKCLQEAKIPPWQRDQVQLLYANAQLLGVLTAQGFWVNQVQTSIKNNWVKDGWLPCLVPSTNNV